MQVQDDAQQDVTELNRSRNENSGLAARLNVALAQLEDAEKDLRALRRQSRLVRKASCRARGSRLQAESELDNERSKSMRLEETLARVSREREDAENRAAAALKNAKTTADLFADSSATMRAANARIGTLVAEATLHTQEIQQLRTELSEVWSPYTGAPRLTRADAPDL